MGKKLTREPLQSHFGAGKKIHAEMTVVFLHAGCKRGYSKAGNKRDGANKRDGLMKIIKLDAKCSVCVFLLWVVLFQFAATGAGEDCRLRDAGCFKVSGDSCYQTRPRVGQISAVAHCVF